MIRFAHAADLHLDSALAGIRTDETDARPAVFTTASRTALILMVDRILEERLAFLVIAGDIWDGNWKDAGTGRFFSRQMTRLREAGIPVYAIRGNHDAEALSHVGAIDFPAVHFLKFKAPESIEVPGTDVVIHGQSYPQNLKVGDLVSRYPKAVPGKINIGLLHTSLDGTVGDHTSYAPCTLSDLDAKGYDYWALGHVHTRTTWERQSGIVHFPGNLQGRHIKETGPHGFSIVTVREGRAVVPEFVAVDAARWEKVTVDLSGCEDEQGWARLAREPFVEAIRAAGGQPVACRVTLKGRTPLDLSLRARHAATVANLQQAADFTTDLWIEKVVVETEPACDVEADSLAMVELNALRARVFDGDARERTVVADEIQALTTRADWLPDALVDDTLVSDAVLRDAFAIIEAGLRGQP